jgi:5-methylthioribose kinase
MNDAQALIHGDLHSGSIFVKGGSAKVFDPEFAFYGPIGYDVGNFIGNLCFAWANAFVSIHEPFEKNDYIRWLDETIALFVDLFAKKFLIAFRQNVTDPLMATTGFGDWLLSEVLSDSAGVAGLEMNRRTVGVAQVRDLTSLGEANERARAERIVIGAAKDFIIQRSTYSCGRQYCATLHDVAGRN